MLLIFLFAFNLSNLGVNLLVVENGPESHLVVLVLMNVVAEELAEPEPSGVHFVMNKVSPVFFLCDVVIPNCIHSLLKLHFLESVEALQQSMLAEEPSLGYFVENLRKEVFLLLPVQKCSWEHTLWTLTMSLGKRYLSQIQVLG